MNRFDERQRTEQQRERAKASQGPDITRYELTTELKAGLERFDKIVMDFLDCMDRANWPTEQGTRMRSTNWLGRPTIDQRAFALLTYNVEVSHVGGDWVSMTPIDKTWSYVNEGEWTNTELFGRDARGFWATRDSDFVASMPLRLSSDRDLSAFEEKAFQALRLRGAWPS